VRLLHNTEPIHRLGQLLPAVRFRIRSMPRGGGAWFRAFVLSDELAEAFQAKICESGGLLVAGAVESWPRLFGQDLRLDKRSPAMKGYP
jgi:hypothetical protein